jgi:hypothetical protein
MRIIWKYSAERHSVDTVEALAKHCADVVTVLVDSADRAGADIALAGIDPAVVQRISAAVDFEE